MHAVAMRNLLDIVEGGGRNRTYPDPADPTSWKSWPKRDRDAIRLEYHGDGGILWIDMFEIPPSRHGRGAGAKLWRHFEESLPPDVSTIKLMAADAGDGPSEGFWKKMGFGVESRSKKHGTIMTKRNPNAPSEAGS